jgi:hypothetical protein
LFQIERSDTYDASAGFRYRFAETGFIAANVLVAMNSQGVSAEITPTIEIEYAFSTAWSR